MIRFPATLLATCCVPWTAAGDLDCDLFRDSIRTLLAHGLDHLYVFGTAGEGHAVTDRQFDDVLAVFAEEMAHAYPMAGVISLSLGTVIERIERIAAAGIGQVQISLPSWGALADRELELFFAETVGRFPQLEFLHYNLPRSRRVLTPTEYGVLAERYPNLVATKNAGARGAVLRGLFEQAPQLRHYLTEPGYAEAALAGFPQAGLLLSIASIHPDRARAYARAGADGDMSTVEQLGGELAELADLLMKALGDDRMDGAYDKCFSRLLDDRFPLRLLPPYLGATEAQYAEFVTAARTAQPQWFTAAYRSAAPI